MKRNRITIILSFLLIISLLFNILQLYVNEKMTEVSRFFSRHGSVIEIENSNNRESIFSIHNINEAHQYAKGEGIKVGVMDWLFEYDQHSELYSGGKNFTDNDKAMSNSSHGYWMSMVLKEVAPECEVYALVAVDYDNEDNWSNYLIEAVDWAIENKLDILTLSHKPLTGKSREKFKSAIEKAHKNNIVTTFIHYEEDSNILPAGMFDLSQDFDYSRTPDLNIFHYDYNFMFIDNYIKYKKGEGNIYGLPYSISISSTSPVVGGFIAILKSINNTLSPEEYKKILVETSYELNFEDPYSSDNPVINCTRVVDIEKAVLYLINNY